MRKIKSKQEDSVHHLILFLQRVSLVQSELEHIGTGKLCDNHLDFIEDTF